MKNIVLVLLLAFSTNGIIQAQKTLAGITMPRKVMIGQTVLGLNGAGIRDKSKMYICALYLKTLGNDANSIIEKDEHMSLKIHFLTKSSRKKMVSDLESILKKSTKEDVKTVKKSFDQFKKVFDEELEKDDVYDIVYVPDRGTVIFKNGMIQPIIEGVAFKQALFGIWLGNKPLDKKLKENLLGKD